MSRYDFDFTMFRFMFRFAICRSQASTLITIIVLTVTIAVCVSLNRPLLAADEPDSYEDGQKYFESGHFGKAREVWTKSAAQGDVKSQFRLGTLYEEGTIVTKDLVEAHLWYSLATESNHKKAESARFRIETSMSDEQLLNAQALLAEFGPLYNPSEEESESESSSGATIDLNVFTAVPDSAAVNMPQADTDAADNAPPAADPSATGSGDVQAAEVDVAVVAEDVQEPSQTDAVSTGRSDDSSEIERRERRLKLLQSSGPGPEVVGNPAIAASSDTDTEIAVEESSVNNLADAEEAADRKLSQHIATATQQALEQSLEEKRANEEQILAAEKLADEKFAAELMAAQKIAKEQASKAPAENEQNAQPAQPAEAALDPDIAPEDAKPAADSSPSEPEADAPRPVEASNLEQLVEEPEVPLPTLALADPYPESEEDSSVASASLGFTESSDDRAGVQRIQTMLSELGYVIIGETGEIGPETRKAIKAFRRDSSLLVSTLIDVDFLATLYARHADLKK